MVFFVGFFFRNICLYIGTFRIFNYVIIVCLQKHSYFLKIIQTLSNQEHSVLFFRNILFLIILLLSDCMTILLFIILLLSDCMIILFFIIVLLSLCRDICNLYYNSVVSLQRCSYFVLYHCCLCSEHSYFVLDHYYLQLGTFVQ